MEETEKKKLGGINRDVVVFAFFLLLSFILWYLNSLSKEIEADIRYPVKIVNVPKGRSLTEDSQLRLNLSLKGPGYSILKLKAPGKKTPVTIDLSKVSYKRVPESKSLDYYILTATLTKSFTVQLRSGCDIISIKPDTLFVSMTKEESGPLNENRVVIRKK